MGMQVERQNIYMEGTYIWKKQQKEFVVMLGLGLGLGLTLILICHFASCVQLHDLRYESVTVTHPLVSFFLFFFLLHTAGSAHRLVAAARHRRRNVFLITSLLRFGPLPHVCLPRFLRAACVLSVHCFISLSLSHSCVTSRMTSLTFVFGSFQTSCSLVAFAPIVT